MRPTEKWQRRKDNLERVHINLHSYFILFWDRREPQRFYSKISECLLYASGFTNNSGQIGHSSVTICKKKMSEQWVKLCIREKSVWRRKS